MKRKPFRVISSGVYPQTASTLPETYSTVPVSSVPQRKTTTGPPEKRSRSRRIVSRTRRSSSVRVPTSRARRSLRLARYPAKTAPARVIRSPAPKTSHRTQERCWPQKASPGAGRRTKVLPKANRGIW